MTDSALAVARPGPADRHQADEGQTTSTYNRPPTDLLPCPPSSGLPHGRPPMQAPAPALGGGAAAPLSGVAAAGGSVAAPASSGGGGGSATMPIPITKAQKSTILSSD